MKQKKDAQAWMMVGCLSSLVPLCITVIWWANFVDYFSNPAMFLKTMGTITNSRVVFHGGKASGYNFAIEYDYQVASKYYSSDRVTFGEQGTAADDFARSYVRKYPVDRRVTVFYKPSDPAFAVLEPNNTQGTGGVLLLTIGWFIVSVAAFATGHKMWRVANTVG